MTVSNLDVIDLGHFNEGFCCQITTTPNFIVCFESSDE